MLTLSEINEEMKDLKDWSLEADSISKVVTFANFAEARDFVNKIGEIADRLNHHPDIYWQLDTVKIVSMTKCEKGLSKKDFELAKEIDRLETK